MEPEFLPNNVRTFLEESLSKVHGAFVALAARIGGTVSLEHHRDPHCAITVSGTDGIVRKIEICPVLRETSNQAVVENWEFSLGIAAWKDESDMRRFWAEMVSLLATLKMSDKKLAALLDQAWEKLRRIKVTDLSETIDRP
jgi:hypothetical protein